MTAVDSIISDLATIVDQCRWAHVHGYWKAGRGLDREHGADLSRPEAERLAGPTFDLEVGDHNARTAYQHAITAVNRADVLLASLVEGPQPPLLRLTTFASPQGLETVAVAAAWRAEHMTLRNERRVALVRSTLDRAVRGLSKALDAGTADGIAHAETPCKTCRIRPRAERAKTDGTMRVSKAGECDVCATWRQRNGTERPAAKLDGAWLNEARAAQARRRARGEDWGAA